MWLPRRLSVSLLLHFALVAAATERKECGGPVQVDHEAVSSQSARCQAYRRVCFDQGAIVSFDEAHSPANRTSVPLPRLNISHLAYNWGGSGGAGNTDRLRHPLAFYEPLPLRFASPALEATPELRAPQFAACTVPVVLFSMWIHNFAEVFSHVVSRVWALQRDNALPHGNTLVIGTPAGELAPPFLPFLLAPFTPHAVVSLAEFSQRGSGGSVASGGRCFEAAYLCAFSYGYYVGDLGAAQAVYQHYRPGLLAPPAEARFEGGSDVLKVLIDRRRGPARNLLNAAALVEECNRGASWTEQRGAVGGAAQRVQCRLTTLGSDGAANLATVRGADVLVCVHGASCTNWLFMRPGSALLELRPYGFGSLARAWADSHFAAISREGGHQQRWYGLNIEDPALCKPSRLEEEWPAGAHASARQKEARDRHVRLPFATLRAMLLRAAEAHGDAAAYLRQRQHGQHYTELLPGGLLRPVSPADDGEQQGAAGSTLGTAGSRTVRHSWAWLPLLVAAAAAGAVWASRRARHVLAARPIHAARGS